MTLAAFMSELGPLISQLEAAVAAGDSVLASAGQLFEWRIRARILQDKLYQVAKPPGAAKSGEEIQDVIVAPVFSSKAADQARAALPQAGALRDALQNKRLKLALDAARAVERMVIA